AARARRARRIWSTLKGQAGRLAEGQEMLETAWSLAGQGWDATRRTCEQQMANARRAPSAVTGALVGWSRTALKGLRAYPHQRRDAINAVGPDAAGIAGR